MDSQTAAKINALQRDLAELELREASLTKELNEIHGKMKLVKQEIASVTKDDKVTTEILERVYAQRRGS